MRTFAIVTAHRAVRAAFRCANFHFTAIDLHYTPLVSESGRMAAIAAITTRETWLPAGLTWSEERAT
jgi:hypothetical protein